MTLEVDAAVVGATSCSAAATATLARRFATAAKLADTDSAAQRKVLVLSDVGLELEAANEEAQQEADCDALTPTAHTGVNQSVFAVIESAANRRS